MSASHGVWAALGAATLRHRIVVVALLVAITLAAIAALPSVRFAPDVTRLLPDDHPHVRLAQLLDERAAPSRSLWLVFGDDDVAARIPAAIEALRASPFVAEVAATRDELFGAAIERVRRAPVWYLPADVLDAFERTLTPAGLDAAIAETRALLEDDPLAGREVATRDPLGLRWLTADPWARFGLQPGTPYAVFDGGRRALVRVLGVEPAWDANYSTALMADLEQRLAGLPFDAFGGYVVARSDAARIRGDLESSTIGTVLGIALFLTWSMRSFRGPPLVLLPVGLSIFWAIPLASAWFGPLASVAVAAAAVLCGLGVDFAMHYVSVYRGLRTTLDHRAAVPATHQRIGPPLMIGMATTAGAFLSLGFGELAGLRGFGYLLALGLVACLVATLLLLPLVLPWFDGRGVGVAVRERSHLAAFADRVAHGPHAWIGIAVGVVLGVGGATLAVVHGLRLDANPDALRPADDPVLATRTRLEAELGFTTVPIVVLAPVAAPVDPLLDGLAALQDDGTLRFFDGVDAAMSERRQARVAAFRTQVGAWRPAADAALTAHGLAVAPFAAALDDLAARIAADPPPTDPAHVVFDGRDCRVVVAYPTQRTTGTAWDALVARVHAACGDVEVYGTPRLVAELERVLGRDLGRVAWFAALLTIVLVGVATRSWRAGFVALLPCALGVGVTLGGLAALDVPLNLASFVAVPFLIGIGVDDGVHLVAHFRSGASHLGATGVAVVRTSVTTGIGFGSLVTASSPGLANLGAIVAVGVVVCLATSLFVLPPLRRIC